MPSLGSAEGQQSRKSPPVAKLAARQVVDAGGMNDVVWALPRTMRTRNDVA